MKRVLVIENNGIENLDKYPSIIEAQGAHVHVFKAHEIPEGGTLIATGDPCPVEGFVKGNIRGILFHFEVDYEELSRWLDSGESGLSAVNKTRDQVLENVSAVEAEMRLNAEKLISNFLKMID